MSATAVSSIAAPGIAKPSAGASKGATGDLFAEMAGLVGDDSSAGRTGAREATVKSAASAARDRAQGRAEDLKTDRERADTASTDPLTEREVIDEDATAAAVAAVVPDVAPMTAPLPAPIQPGDPAASTAPTADLAAPVPSVAAADADAAPAAPPAPAAPGLARVVDMMTGASAEDSAGAVANTPADGSAPLPPVAAPEARARLEADRALTPPASASDADAPGLSPFDALTATATDVAESIAAPRPVAPAQAPPPSAAVQSPLAPPPTPPTLVAAAPPPAPPPSAPEAPTAAVDAATEVALAEVAEAGAPGKPVGSLKTTAQPKSAARTGSDPAALDSASVADPASPPDFKAVVTAVAQASPADGEAPGSPGQGDAAPDVETTPVEHAQVPQAAPPPPAQVGAAATTAAAATSGTVAHLAAQIVRRVEGRVSRFDVRLDPDGLGQVNVAVQIDAQGRLSASMIFDRPESAEAMKARAGELRAALERSGFDLSAGGLSFEAGDGANFAGQGGAERGRHAAPDRGRAFGAALETADQADLAQAAAYRPKSVRNLDIRI